MRKYFSITSFAILIWTIYVIIFSIWSNDDVISMLPWCCLVSIPFIVIFIIDFLDRKIKNVIYLILFRIFRFLIILYLLLNMILITAFSTWTQKVPLINYSKTLKELVSEENSYKINHFPLVIPKGAKNYYFCYDDSWQDGSVHFLRFNISAEYLDEIVNKNQQNISNVMNYSEFYQNYYQGLLELGIEKRRKRMSEDEFKQSEKEYTVYILKNEQNDNDYTSGFIASKKYKEIIFFYATYNLKKKS